MNDLYHDSISNKLFGFVFSRSDEPIVIGVCGMRSADQDHRIRSEPIVSGSFLESGPVYWRIYASLGLNELSNGPTIELWGLAKMCSERDSPLEPFVLPAPGQPELARLTCGAHLGPSVLDVSPGHAGRRAWTRANESSQPAAQRGYSAVRLL